MLGPRLYTYQDAIRRCRQGLAGGAGLGDNTLLAEAVLEAYDDLIRGHDWRYFYRLHRINVYGAVTAECSYDADEGEFAAAEWPEWAGAGTVVRVGLANHLIRRRVDDQTLLADEAQRPRADLDAGTACEVFQQYYPLPHDYRAGERPLQEEGDWSDYVSPGHWARLQREDFSVGAATAWTILADPYLPGRYALATYPAWETNRQIDLLLQRWPRALRYDGLSEYCRAGSVAAADGVVAGTNTLFESGMGGAVLRLARAGASAPPDGQAGLHAFERQTLIDADAEITSGSLTVMEDWTISGPRRYTISDPLDLSPAMLEAFWTRLDWKLGQRLKLRDRPVSEQDYLLALARAKAADAPARKAQSPYGSRGRAKGYRVDMAIEE